MATTTKVLARTAAATTNTILYTVPNSSTLAIVTNIVATNTAASAATFTISIDGVALLSGVSLAANSSAFFDLKQVIPANAIPKTVNGFASATTVNFHISGVEIA